MQTPPVRGTRQRYGPLIAQPAQSYDWLQARETERVHTDSPSQSDADKRSRFERDRARIIHSIAFRRLQGKTQIFAPATADYLRTRVTHSIEVSQIGRGLAKTLGVPGSLVEAACLGHDLGHPPFGHTGEDALDRLMEKHGGFEGNAQSFRIVTRLEQKHPDYEGLDLCRASVLGLIKYPFRRGANGKYLYGDDADAYEEWLFKGTGLRLLTEASNHAPPRTLPCQIMDWADDIAYSVHDLEDGVASGYLRPATWDSDRFVETIWRSVCGAPIRFQDGPPSQDTVAGHLDGLARELAPWEPEIPKDIMREVTRSYIDKFASAVDVECPKKVATSFDFQLRIPEEIRIENQVLKSITIEYILRDDRTAALFHKGEEIITRLFEALFDSTQAPARHRFLLFPRSMRPDLDSDRDNQSALARATCDHIASMTEGQALTLYSRLFEPAGGSPYGPSS